MRVWAGCLLGLTGLCGASLVWGQGAPSNADVSSIETRLKAAPFLMLRGMWDGGQLGFDAQGRVIGSPGTRLFSLSAVLVAEVRLTDSSLEIDGERAGLVIEASQSLKKGVRAVALDKRGKGVVSITIARDAAHPEALAAAVQKVVSSGIDDALMTTAPSYWQVWLRRELHPELPPLPLPPGVYGSPAETFDENKLSAIHAPVLIYGPDPKFTREAKQQGYQGMSLIGLIVDPQGRPESEWIERAIGMGLDEAAIATVMQYRFKAATLRGTPVSVRVNIEVNFRNY